MMRTCSILSFLLSIAHCRMSYETYRDGNGQLIKLKNKPSVVNLSPYLWTFDKSPPDEMYVYDPVSQNMMKVSDIIKEHGLKWEPGQVLILKDGKYSVWKCISQSK